MEHGKLSYLDFCVTGGSLGAKDRTTNKRWELMFGEVSSSESALDEASAVVAHDNSIPMFVCHCDDS